MRFTVQVSRAQRVGEARVSGINFVFDIWGIGVGYWFCVSFFFFFRGGFLAELLRSRFGGFLYLPAYIFHGRQILLFSFDLKFANTSFQYHMNLKKKEREKSKDDRIKRKI